MRQLRVLALGLSVFFVAACGSDKKSANTFEKATAECAGEAIPHRYFVQWKDGSTSSEIAPSDEEFIDSFLTENAKHIEFPEPDYRVQVNPIVSRSVSAKMNAADNWGPQSVNVQSLWRQGHYGQGVTVAVVDTGLDRDHAQLRDQLAVNDGETGTDSQGRDKKTNGVDDDGNGFVDDWAGYDFVAKSGDVFDYNRHGTHVSGIIAAKHSDTTAQAANYVQGMAPKAKILPLPFLGAGGSGAISDAVLAIDYAVNRNVQLINASWGGSSCSRALRERIAALENLGILFVAAAGNERADIDVFKQFPASFLLNSQITVGSITSSGIMASHSNYGDLSVQLFAPGVGITSTVPGGMATFDGTSMATPFVTGALALLRGAQPTATIADLRHALLDSTFKQNDYRNTSQGRLQLSTSLKTLKKSIASHQQPAFTSPKPHVRSY